MLIRALIVLLAILNLGIAAWWLSRSDAVEPSPPPEPAGAPRLQLAGEAPQAHVAVPAAEPVAMDSPAAGDAPAAPATAAPSVPSSPRCYALGPFDDAAAASAAAARINALASHTREEPAAASAYTVFLPPVADRAAAQAVAQRIGAAGFDDFRIIANGELANGIALGRYRSRDSALRRQTTLREAGFDAQLQHVGPAGASKWWTDVSVAADAAIGTARRIDCATLR